MYNLIDYYAFMLLQPRRRQLECPWFVCGWCGTICLYLGPCHHVMASPWVVDGGYGLQIRTVVANILSKQSQTAYELVLQQLSL
jgi:hypothetical protein